ncbi:YadA C-terminal domain-containing protein [Vibrio mediterranei]|uniref:YadA C-terminal domain-containing protein n=1 Tax=Vibrio mediterranei TaxID=689 RepID=UPI0038CEA8EC
MKKTLIALAVTSLFSVGTYASLQNDSVQVVEIENIINKLGEDGYQYDTVSGEIKDASNNRIGRVDSENGVHNVLLDNEIIKVDTKKGKLTHVTQEREGKLKYKHYDIRDDWNPNNDIINGDPNPDYEYFDAAEVSTRVRDYIKDNKLDVNDDGQVFDKNGNQVGQVTATEKGGAKYISFGPDGKEKHISFEDGGEGSVKITTEDKVNPQPKPLPNPNVTVDDMHRIYNDVAPLVDDMNDRINSNTSRINTLEQDMKAMGNKMLDLEDRMDGVVATSHAVTNARPMVQDAGEFAMGVGIGAAGSKQALALGGAYQFNANWSSSMTVNYETAGKRSNSQVSAGAGVQYRFK